MYHSNMLQGITSFDDKQASSKVISDDPSTSGVKPDYTFAVVLNVITHPPPVMLRMMAYSHSVILGVMTHLPPVMLSMMA